MCFFRNVDGVSMIRQDGNRQRIRQSKNRVGGSAIVAEIVKDDRKPRRTVLFALPRRCRRSGACRRGDNVDRIRDHARAAIIQPQKRSRTRWLVARQIVRRRNAIQGLDEIGHRFPPGLFGAARRQRHEEMIRSIRMRTIKLEAGDDVSGLFTETRGGMHHFTGDGVDLAGRKVLWMLALAAAEENRR